MKPYVWNPDHTPKQASDGAYWERNMLALLLANLLNLFAGDYNMPLPAGWYRHEGEGFDGWSRVISIYHGEMTFHVPDDFDLGFLPEIAPNWDGHTTEEKWYKAMKTCGIMPASAQTNSEDQ